jgi:hypothetical protein
VADPPPRAGHPHGPWGWLDHPQGPSQKQQKKNYFLFFKILKNIILLYFLFFKNIYFFNK